MFNKKQSIKSEEKNIEDHNGSFANEFDENDFYGILKIVGGVTNISDPSKPHNIGIDIAYTKEMAEDFTDEQIARLTKVVYLTGLKECVEKVVNEIVTIAVENISKKFNLENNNHSNE